MRSFTAIVVILLSTRFAAADEAKPTEPKAAAAPTCKRVMVGHGLDRHAVCRFEAPIIIKVGAPRPNVLIVQHRDARAVVGPPRSSDRLTGLSHHLE